MAECVCECGFWDVNTLETGVEFFIAIRFNLYETRKLFEYFMVSSGLILLSLPSVFGLLSVPAASASSSW